METMTTTLSQDCQRLKELRAIEDDLKAEHSAAKEERERFEAELIERMEYEEADGHKTDGANYVPAETPYGQIQDRDVFVAWARENEPELLETKERKALINQLAREHLDDGRPLPPGMGFYVKQYISIRGAS